MCTVERPSGSVWLSVLISLVSMAGGRPARASRASVIAAGNDQVFWAVVIDEPERGHDATVRCIFRKAPDEHFARPRHFLPEIGRPARIAAKATDLHIIFDDGTHRRYTPTSAYTERKLPNGIVPEALAGDAELPVLYAVVPSHVAAKLLTTQPAAGITVPPLGSVATRPKGAPSTATRPGVGFSLVRFQRGRWRPWRQIPSWFDAQDQCWLSARRGIVHIFWQENNRRSTVWYNALSGDEWGEITSLQAPGAILLGWALAVAEDELAFVVALAADGGGWRLGVLLRAADSWQSMRTLRGERKDLLVLPNRVAAASFDKSVALAVRDEQDQVSVGRWLASGGAPLEAVRPARGLVTPRQPWNDPRLSTWLPLILVTGALLLVFWRRQESITRTIALPVGISLAGYGKRLLAFVIDLAPAVVATMPLWRVPLSTAFREYGSAAPFPSEQGPDDIQLWIGWLVIRVVYAVYCAGCEFMFHATPGKLALRCRVISEDLQPCRARQILARNLVRIIELDRYLVPLLVLVFLTRNRQRLGDLAARTLVVEISESPSPPDEGGSDN